MQNQAIYPLLVHAKSGLLSAVVSVSLKLKLARTTLSLKKARDLTKTIIGQFPFFLI